MNILSDIKKTYDLKSKVLYPMWEERSFCNFHRCNTISSFEELFLLVISNLVISWGSKHHTITLYMVHDPICECVMNI